MKAPPPKIEIEPFPSSDEEDMESDYGTDNLHRPKIFLSSRANSAVDVSYEKG